MSKRELVLDFTSLLDVIMIILFLVVCTMSNQTIDSKEEAEKYAQIADQNQILALNLSNKNAQLESDIKDTEAELANANAIIDEMTAKILQLMKDIEVRDEDINDLNKDLEDVHIKLTDKEQKLSDTTNELNKYIALYEQLVKDLDDKKAEVEKNNAEIKDLTSQLATTQGKLESTEDKLQETKNELAEVKGDNKDLQNKIEGNLEVIAGLKETIGKLEAQIESLKDNSSSVDDKYKELDTKYSVTLAELMKVKEELAAEKSSHKTDNDNNKSAIDAQNAQIAALTKQLQAAIAKAASEKAELNKTIEDLETENQIKQETIDNLHISMGFDPDDVTTYEPLFESLAKIIINVDSWVEKENYSNGETLYGISYKIYSNQAGEYKAHPSKNDLTFYYLIDEEANSLGLRMFTKDSKGKYVDFEIAEDPWVIANMIELELTDIVRKYDGVSALAMLTVNFDLKAPALEVLLIGDSNSEYEDDYGFITHAYKGCENHAADFKIKFILDKVALN